MTASFAQTSFLGGEWSRQMQGRFDRPDYREGMNVCLNIIPIEEGSAPRRSGTRLGGVTRNGAYGVLREYNVSQAQPYDLELTAGFLRVWLAGAGLLTHAGTAVTAISAANPAVFTSAGHGFTTGDQATFSLGGATTYAGIAQVLGRQLSVTVLTSSTFTAVDALTGAAIDGAQISFAALTNLKVYRIYEFVTPYTQGELQQVRLVQDGADALLLHPSHPPQTFKVTVDAAGLFTGATLTPTVFYDGPYLDIPSDGTTLTPSALTGTITLTASSIASINGGIGFQATDVGRMVRFFSEPIDWVPGTYAAGRQVKDAGVYWRAVGDGANNPILQPSTDSGVNWVIDPTAAAWTWGTIASVSSPTVVTATMHAAVKYPDNTAGGDLKYINAAVAWQLGAYSATTGYPSVGAYYQGRVWLGGAIKNRFDACVSNDFSVNGYINFAPTGLDGTVADNNGIAGTLNAKEVENFLWMLPDEQGVLAGTQSGEWTISGSAANEPITATSIVARETSHYGSTSAQAIKVNKATIFVHRDTRKVYEYMANYFTQKFVADNLSLKAKHLTKSGVAEIAYMRELTPVIWCRLNNGGLIGCTYKHDDPIKPLEFSAWHQHTLGTGRNVISIQGGPANGGETDTISLVTQDPLTNFCYVEFLQTLWDEGDDLLTAWYVDGGAAIAAAELVDPATIRLYGMWYMVGQQVTVWGAGLDLGDFTVSAAGTIDLPFNAQTSLFTSAFLAELTAQGCKPLGVDIIGTTGAATFIMEAKENYDSAHVATIAGLTTYTGARVRADQNWQGIQWDAVRRNLMYMYTEHLPTTPLTNTTGHRLWDGQTAILAGGAVNPDTQFNSSVCAKNIDTDAVTYYPNYNVANVVPNGIGGSDGTARRFTRDFATGPDPFVTQGNGPGMTDPYTGDFWVNSSSCQLYCFRAQDSYSQIISPLFPVDAPANDVCPLGFTNTGPTNPWTFAQEINEVAGGTVGAKLYLVPRLLTATEITHDYLLAYATFAYPVTAPAASFRVYNREVFDHAGHMYLFSCSKSGAKNFKLYRFTAPTSAPYGGPTIGGGFTDITPWSAGTGPNADGAAYTHARLEFADTVTPPSHSLIPMYLPATDTLVLIEKFFPSEKSNDDDYLTPGDMFWSCTYVGTPAGTPTYDHHSAFVTGYMSAAWTPTNAAGAAYSVADAFEVNNYLGQSDYSYSIDYTTRWFFFVCTKMVNGVSDGKPRIVLVNYQLVSGSAPSVLQVLDEQGWDDAYPAYRPSTDAYDPYVSTAAGNVAASMTAWLDPCYPQPRWDAGIYDPVTSSFWWSGGATPQVDSTQTAIFGQFNPIFADRMKTALGAPGGTLVAATPPFLKLSFSGTACVPFAVGHTFCSRGQILRPATPQESMTQTGPSLGKKRRTTYAAPLLADAQGVSMGVDFLKMRPLAFKSPGGTVNLTLAQTFSGVYWGTVDADSNYDNMWCWEVCRPYPCTVVAVEIQHKANENV